MVNKCFVFIKAATAFVAALFRANDPVVKFSANGHPLLEGWERCPEEDIALASATENEPLYPRAGFYCYEGCHEGELLRVRCGRNYLGTDAASSVVMTPVMGMSAGASPARYLLCAEKNLTLSSESSERSALFQLNGREEKEGPLFDYDEIELFGNKFLVLDLGMLGNKRQSPTEGVMS